MADPRRNSQKGLKNYKTIKIASRGHSIRPSSLVTLHKNLVAIGYDWGYIKIFDIKAGREIQCMEKDPDDFTTDQFDLTTESIVSLSSKRLATGFADGTIKIWNINNWKCIKTLQHDAKLRSLLALSSQFLAVVNWDAGPITIWNILKGKVERTLNHFSKIITLEVKLHGEYIVALLHDHTKCLAVWDWKTGKLIRTICDVGNICSFDMLSDDLIVTGYLDGKIKVLDFITGETKLQFETNEQKQIVPTAHDLSYAVCELIVLPNGDVATTNWKSKAIKIWDSKTGKNKQILEGHLCMIWELAISVKGDLISRSMDRTIKLWAK